MALISIAVFLTRCFTVSVWPLAIASMSPVRPFCNVWYYTATHHCDMNMMKYSACVLQIFNKKNKDDVTKSFVYVLACGTL